MRRAKKKRGNERKEEEEEETATATMSRRAGGIRRDGDILIMEEQQSGEEERGIKERGSKKRTLVRRKGATKESENIVAPSFFFSFILSVPDLNSSQASLQPFGLRLNVRPSLLSFSLFSLLSLSYTRPSSTLLGTFFSLSLSLFPSQD